MADMQDMLGMGAMDEGIETNVDYQYEILNHPDYIAGDIDIEFIEKFRTAIK